MDPHARRAILAWAAASAAVWLGLLWLAWEALR